jgi:hypothetical protein
MKSRFNQKPWADFEWLHIVWNTKLKLRQVLKPRKNIPKTITSSREAGGLVVWKRW